MCGVHGSTVHFNVCFVLAEFQGQCSNLDKVHCPVHSCLQTCYCHCANFLMHCLVILSYNSASTLTHTSSPSLPFFF